ncbi:MAG: ribbon-helix-helix domain-containing protein [Pseudomonadota bacterium]
MTFPRPKKRSLTLQGHRTSVSIEEPFWTIFCEIAEDRGLSVNRLAAELDARRTPPASLASAIRLYVLERVTIRSQSERKGPGVKP